MNVNNRLISEYTPSPFLEERESLYKIYQESDRGALKKIIETYFSKKVIEFARKNQKLKKNDFNKAYRNFLVERADTLSKKISKNDAATRAKIQAFFHYKLGVEENQEKYFNEDSSIEKKKMGEDFKKLLIKLSEGKFLDDAAKEEKVRTRELDRLYNDLDVDVIPTVLISVPKKLEEIPDITDTAALPVHECSPFEEPNTTEPKDSIINGVPHNITPNSQSDHVTDTKTPAKKWPLPIRFAAAIFKGIGNLFSAIFFFPFRMIQILFTKS